MTKKKVLFLITKSSWGGAQQYVFDLATNLDPERYDPVVAVGGTGELYDRLRTAGLRVISINGLGRNVSIFSDLLASAHIVWLLAKERPMVLHVNSSKVGGLGTFFGRLLFIPRVIFTSHGWAFNEDRPGWQKQLLKFLQWVTVLFSHRTITVSTAVKRDMDWPLTERKMQVIHLGRDVSVLKKPAVARELLSMKVQNNHASLYEFRKDVWIGTVAELHPSKCIDVAIAAVAELVTDVPTLRYVIIHDGQERERLEQLVTERGLTDHIFFTGMVPEAATLLPAFDLFVLPSQTEALGYVLIEAGHAGVPVVASNVGGIPDIITHQETGLLVPPKNKTELVAALRSLITDKRSRTKLGAALQEKATQFTVAKMIARTEAVYEQQSRPRD